MQALCEEEITVIWEWFGKWLASLPEHVEEQETLNNSVDKLFDHVFSQEQIINNLKYDLKHVGISLNKLKEDFAEIKQRVKGKPVQKFRRCTQEQVRYYCGHSKDGEFIKCSDHDGKDYGCSEASMVYTDTKTSTHSCRECTKRARQKRLSQEIHGRLRF